MKGKPEVQEVTFKPAKGGVISETRMKVKRGGQGGGPDFDYDHETAIHPTLKHAVAHLKKHLGHHFTEGSAEEEAHESKAEAKQEGD